ncbi:MAG: T9SS type A sorting domain-containing protein, partial [candidate division KSB1 bacterium]|nr:T9SS type A sorting domain-containing protein [candidate division KSB1 bacterium]
TFSDFFINFDLEGPADILTDGKHKGKVIDQYFGGEPNLLGLFRAQKLTIEAPTELNNIDFILQPACKISGRVTESETGAPVHQLYVAALEDSSGYPFYPWAAVNDSGRYELRALPKGRYKLLALTGFTGKTDLLPEYFGGSRSFYTAQVVELNRERLEGIDFALERGATLEGFILLPDGRRLGADVQDGIPVVAFDADSGETASYDFVQFNGGFRIDRLLPGNYKLAVMPRPPFAAAYCGGGAAFDDPLAETIALKYGQIVGDKTIVLSEASGILRGVVSDSLGKPLSGVMLAAYDRTGHMVAYAVTGIDSRTGKQLNDPGAYEMPNLKPGEYAVRTIALFMATSILDLGLELFGGLEAIDPLSLLLGGDLGNLRLDWNFYQDQWYGGAPATLTIALDKLLFQLSSYGLANAADVALTPIFLPIPFFDVVPEKAVRVKIVGGTPVVANFKLGRVKWNKVVSGANEPAAVYDFVLHQNYPNPFNPQTRITFTLPRGGWVDIAVFDALGRLVGEPIRRHYSEGMHSIDWQAVTAQEGKLAAGIYFLRLKAFGETRTIKMTLLK